MVKLSIWFIFCGGFLFYIFRFM